MAKNKTNHEGKLLDRVVFDPAIKGDDFTVEQEIILDNKGAIKSGKIKAVKVKNKNIKLKHNKA